MSQQQFDQFLRGDSSLFMQFIENVNEVFWLVDLATMQVLYVSPAYERIWQRTPDSIYSNPDDWILGIHEDDREKVKEAYYAQGPKGNFSHEYRIVRPDGSIRWIWDRSFPILNEKGEIYRLCGIAEDITQRKIAREQLNGYKQRLDFRKHQLEKVTRMNIVGEMASGLAHELNQPLTVVSTLAQGLVGRLSGKNIDIDDTQFAIQKIVEQVGRGK